MILPLLLLAVLTDHTWAQPGTYNHPGKKDPAEDLLYPALVQRFYTLNDHQLFWMKDEKDMLRRQKLLGLIDSAYYMGLAEKKYHYAELLLNITGPFDSAELQIADRLYTDAAIALCKDVFQGYKTKPWVGYDQLSEKYAEQDNEYLLKRLVNTRNADSLAGFLASLEPSLPEYAILKKELRKQLEENNADTVVMLRSSLNYLRWIHHFGFEQFIVINLPETQLRYYEKDSIALEMKIVAGQTSTPTPRFATVCDQVILYPYWYVPASILFNEYLPKIKNNPSWIDANNMQVIDGSGKVMNHLKMNWSGYHKGNFPYTLRQSTGCDNALGVIKFNIITPYGVYMHDTNKKYVFLSVRRYFSHGCMRLEKPFELADKLVPGKINPTYLESCFKEQKPEFIRLPKTIPVFSVYKLAVVNASGKVVYYKDIYKLFR
jgi:L,D-transpeptidase YcbB